MSVCEYVMMWVWSTETRRGTQTPWRWSYRQCEVPSMGTGNLGPLRELYVPITTELSSQYHFSWRKSLGTRMWGHILSITLAPNFTFYGVSYLYPAMILYYETEHSKTGLCDGVLSCYVWSFSPSFVSHSHFSHSACARHSVSQGLSRWVLRDYGLCSSEHVTLLCHVPSHPPHFVSSHRHVSLQIIASRVNMVHQDILY